MDNGIFNSILSNLLPDESNTIKNANDMQSYLAYILENPNEVNSTDNGIVIPNDRKVLTPSEWATTYRLIKGKPMTFSNHPYQKEIFDDMHPRQVVEKSAQMGISELFLTKIFWFGDYHMGKAIYTFPTFGDMLQYAASRLPQIIEGSIDCTPDHPYWEQSMVEYPKTYIEAMLLVNNAKMRRINDFYIYYKGTFGDNSAISIDSDWNIHDEVNFSNQNVLNKFRSRLGASDMAWEYQFSTPTIPGYGVSKTYQMSDMRVWEITCPHCNKSYKMEFSRNCVELAWGKGYIYQCHHCKNEISAETRKSGRFVPQSPSKSKDWHGYHISKMMNPKIDANMLVQSKDAYKKVADFYNFDLGESYSETSTALTMEIMQGIEKPYNMWGSAKKEHKAVMGVDQGDVLWATISIPDDSMPGREKVIYMERIDTLDFDNEDPFQRLPELMEKYNVQMCVIDAMPNKNSARAFKNKYKGKVFMSFYTSTKNGDYNYNDDSGIVNVDRTESFKALFNDIVTGKIITPAGTQIGDLFNRHHTALKKEAVESETTGEIKEFFVKTDHDHLAHSNLYRKIARDILNEKNIGMGTGGGKSVAVPRGVGNGMNGNNRRSIPNAIRKGR